MYLRISIVHYTRQIYNHNGIKWEAKSFVHAILDHLSDIGSGTADILNRHFH